MSIEPAVGGNTEARLGWHPAEPGDDVALLRGELDACRAEIERLRSGGSDLFQLGNFRLHSGAVSGWKIECDALTPADWDALAVMVWELVPVYSDVEGVPRGGLPLADRMREWRTPDGPLLIVDDVLTSGGSMEEHRAGRDAVGAVVFARGRCLPWVTPLFQMTTGVEGRP